MKTLGALLLALVYCVGASQGWAASPESYYEQVYVLLEKNQLDQAKIVLKQWEQYSTDDSEEIEDIRNAIEIVEQSEGMGGELLNMIETLKDIKNKDVLSEINVDE